MKIPLTKLYIDFKSLFRKGVRIRDSVYGVYVFAGFQGTGKTYNAVDYCSRVLERDPDAKIYTNIDSLKYPHTYINKTEDLNPEWRNCYVILDEVHKKYPKQSKCDMAFYSFLQETRKHHRTVILITQEWREIPMWLRRPIKWLVVNNRLPFSIANECWQNAMEMTWSEEENDYVCPVIRKRIKKINKRTAEYYDTNETIYLN